MSAVVHDAGTHNAIFNLSSLCFISDPANYTRNVIVLIMTTKDKNNNNNGGDDNDNDVDDFSNIIKGISLLLFIKFANLILMN